MKKNVDIVRAWREEDYYWSLTEEERSALPAHPSGLLELDEAKLQILAGGALAFTLRGQTNQCTPCPGLNCAA